MVFALMSRVEALRNRPVKDIIYPNPPVPQGLDAKGSGIVLQLGLGLVQNNQRKLSVSVSLRTVYIPLSCIR